MKKVEYVINILHYIIYQFCEKYKRFLPGFSVDINAGRIIMLLSLIPGIQFFIIYMALCKINHKEFQSEYIFLFLIPFGLLVWFLVIHQDKYLIYFKKFKKRPKEVKRKWAWISLITVVLILLLLVFSFSVMTNIT